MNVLVVDDQRLSRAGIVKMIDWERLGLRLAGESANGRDALDRMSELEVDVVVTDVRMPVLDGLQLIEKAKELYPHVAFLVISGFDDYAYVRKSIQLSVADYLLKPVDKNELNSLLEDLIGKTREARDKAAAQLHKTREQFFRLLLEGAYDDEERLREDWSDIRLPEEEEFFVAAIFDSDDEPRKVLERLRLLAERCELFLMRTRGDGYGLIAAGKAELMEELRSALRATLSDRSVYRLAGIGTIAQGIVPLRESIAKAYEAYALQASLPDGPLSLPASSEGPPEDKPTVSLPLNAAWEREWFILIKQGNLAAIQDKINDLGRMATAASPASESSPDWLESLYPYALLRGAKEMFEAGLVEEQAYLEAFRIAKKLPHVAGTAAKQDVLADYFARCLDREPQEQAKKIKEAVEKAKAFVDAHYDQQINLTDLALSYYMSPGYFSTLFRQHTGSNFLEYLTRLRMDHARRLIAANPEGKIGDIAIRCGYQDLKHFRKLFKRYTGLTPLQYKEESSLD